MPVTGDFSKLRTLSKRMANVFAKGQRKAINAEFAEEALARVQRGFEQSRSPYGQRWPKLKYRSGKPLLDTGRLRNSIRARSGADWAGLSTNVVYWATHNFGRDSIPQRRFFPTNRMPPGWGRELKRIVDRHLEEVQR